VHDLQMSRHDPGELPSDLPAPADDGAADHLAGMAMPALALPATDGGEIRVDRSGRIRSADRPLPPAPARYIRSRRPRARA
jgi:hypothetical protein